jgi:hypothetical protein
MTDPASAIKCEVDDLVEQQILTFRQRSSLTSSELDEYQQRADQIRILFRVLDKRKPVPSYVLAQGRSRRPWPIL